ncbi:LysR family transcriptional regulator [Actinocorallia herbida]|nr:LysR family transcriptional regulator [Actinocorallia herbida]
MHDLITRLAVVDGDAASALRVISHFDALLDRKASVSALLRAAAALTASGAGVHDAALGLRLRVDAQGRPAADDGRHGPPAAAPSARCERTTVWLERDGDPGPLDDLVLERCARSVHAVVQETRTGHPAVAAVRLACDPASTPVDRAEALRHLGLHGDLVVVATPVGAAAELPPGPIIDGRRVALVRAEQVDGLLSASVPAGLVRCTAADLPTAHRNAGLALRLAVDPADGGPAHVWFDDLGSLAALAERFDPAEAAAVPDVRLLESLRAERPWVTGLLDTLLSHGSLRQAARRQHLHHSTLGQRVAWLEARLGYPILSPAGHARAATTLLLWRIATSPHPPATAR